MDSLPVPPAAAKLRRQAKEEPPRIVITERVEAILLLLHEYRALSSQQIEEFLALHGYSQQYTGRRLSDLEALRFINQINKRWKYITQGTPHRIWGLGDEGAKHLEKRFSVPRRKARWSDKNREVGPEHVEHCMLVAQVMLAVARACHRRGNVRLIGAHEILAQAPAEIAQAVKPFQWQVEASWEGKRLRLPMVPDKVFGLQFLGHSQRPTFWIMLEADTGSETVMPEDPFNTRKPTIFHKCLAYQASHEQKIHTARYGFNRFRVLFLTERTGVQVRTDPRSGEKRAITRTQSMQEAAMRAGGNLPNLYLFADRGQLLSHQDVLAMPWQTAHGKTAYLDPTIIPPSS